MHGEVALLLSAIAGYWVMERAEEHRGHLRSVGRVLGTSIMLLSLFLLACNMWGGTMYGPHMGMRGKGMCPLMRMAPDGMPAKAAPAQR